MHLYTLMTLQAPLNLLDHVAQLTELLGWQCGPIAESSLVLGPIQS